MRDIKSILCYILILGAIIIAILSILSILPNTTHLQPAQSDKIMTPEQYYKYNCKPITHSDIVKNPNNKMELIVFTGTVIGIQENEDKSYTYTISNAELSDEGGIWKTTSPNGFNIDDIVIIYGTNAIPEYNIVNIYSTYMELYLQ